MPRPPRLQFDGAFYHVFHRGNRRERIYCEDADYAKFEEFMIEAMNWSGVRLFDWSLLPNHFHLLVETPDGNLAEFMQRLATRYAKYFNWAHKKVGHVFQGRYGARLCDKEQYFLELVRYIELNPYRLKKGTLAKLGEWKWSSLRYYLGKQEAPGGMKRAVEEVLSRFGETVEEARKGLAQFLSDGLESGTWEDFYRPKGHRYLGGESFIERMKQTGQEPIRNQRRKLTAFKNAEELGEKIQALGGPTSEELSSASRKRHLSRWRKALVYIGRRYYRFPVLNLATYLKRDGTAVSQMLSRLNGNEGNMPEIARLMKAVEETEPTR